MTSPASEQATIAALSRSAKTPGDEISAPARSAFLDSFHTRHECELCGVVEIDQSLPKAKRKKMADAALSAHMRRIARKSRIARQVSREQEALGKELAQRLRDELAEIVP
jgi:hypothetical protein